MEQIPRTPEVYDFRQYDRIWQRIAPDLEPYPDTASRRAPAPAPETPAVPVPADPGLAVRQEGQLPGAERNPCCMGTEAAELLNVLTGYIEAALSDRRHLLALTRQAPAWARKDLRDIAADLQDQARQLMAAHYLITGQCYRPSISTERIYVGRWCPALRERYHAAACSGLNYARTAEDSLDPCLTKLLEAMSKQSYGHAETLMGLLEQQLSRS